MKNYALWLTFHVSCFLIGLALLLPVPILAQDDITLTATVDRTTLTTDQTLTLQLTLAGKFRNAERPALPALEGFAVTGSSQSSHFSLINGKMSSQVVFTYRLQPLQTGTLTIPAVPITMGGQTYQSQPVTVEVTAGNAPAPQQPGGQAPPDLSVPQTLKGQTFFVEAEVDNPTPVVGAQVLYTFRLYQAGQFTTQPHLEWPEFTSFIGYDITPNTQFQQVIGQQQYLVTEVRRALFATSPGTVTLAPARLVVSGDFFNQGFELATNSVTVQVQPLPADAPAGFTGAVGQLEIEAWTAPTESRVNEPVTLFVRVSGAGNVTAVPDPTNVGEAALPGWRVYDPQITTDINQTDGIVQGEKVFERLLVPKTEGTLTIPAFTLVFYDPVGAYRTAQTTPLIVPVSAGEPVVPGIIGDGTLFGSGKQDVVVLGSDIRHIKAAPSALAAEQNSLLSQPLYWIGWLVPLLAVVGTSGWTQHQRTLTHNVAYARTLRARRAARKRLANAAKLLKGDVDAAYAAVAHALTHYLGDKFNLASAGLTRDMIHTALTERDVATTLIERLLVCLDWADSGRFAPVAAGRDAAALLADAEAVLAELEGAIA